MISKEIKVSLSSLHAKELASLPWHEVAKFKVKSILLDNHSSWSNLILDPEDETKSTTREEYDKGMRDAMKKIALSCDRQFGVDVGYEDLPDLVGSLINPKPKSKTKVEYVKCEFGKLSDLVLSVENGDLYYIDECDDEFSEAKMYTLVWLYRHGGPIYKQVEKEVNWKDELNLKYSAIDFNHLDNDGRRELGRWSQDEFIKLCHLVAELTDKPE